MVYFHHTNYYSDRNQSQLVVFTAIAYDMNLVYLNATPNDGAGK